VNPLNTPAGSLSTTLQPAARAGAKERTERITGEFYGAMTAATPAGWAMVIEYSPGLSPARHGLIPNDPGCLSCRRRLADARGSALHCWRLDP
jgi:hypothetical protein